GANVNDKNGDAGHYSDKELAYIYLKTHQHDLALKHAILEYDRRPDNIEINEMMGWVYYKQGKYSDALPFAEKSLRTNSSNPELICRAGLIYCKNSEIEKGSKLIGAAVNTNPFL